VESSDAECMQQNLPTLQHMKDGMATLRRRIDALEHVVAIANMNLSTLEAAVDKAEAELGVSDRLFGMLNPLSFFVSIIDRSISALCTAIYTDKTIVMQLLYKVIRRLLKQNLIDFRIFQKKTQEPIASSSVPTYKTPIIYKSNDYFQRE